MLDKYYNNVNESVNYSHSRTMHPSTPDFHLHNRFEIYFFISGNVKYFIEKKVYSLKCGDLLVMNSHEIHKPSFVSEDIYERIVIHFDPSIARILSSPGFNLLDCFLNRPAGERNKLNLVEHQVDEITKILHKIEAVNNNTCAGCGILKLSYFTELLVFINRVSMSIQPGMEHHNVPEKLVPILDFIDRNLDSDLTLASLGRKFYMNGVYLSRLFKKSTGSNLHEYIIYKRISLAKKLLLENFSVTETCMQSGFNDYSNFVRMFKRTVGISPGQYKKHNL